MECCVWVLKSGRHAWTKASDKTGPGGGGASEAPGQVQGTKYRRQHIEKMQSQMSAMGENIFIGGNKPVIPPRSYAQATGETHNKGHQAGQQARPPPMTEAGGTGGVPLVVIAGQGGGQGDREPNVVAEVQSSQEMMGVMEESEVEERKAPLVENVLMEQ